MLACRLEGIIRAVVPEQSLIALQDASGSILLKLPQLNSGVSEGERASIEITTSLFNGTRYGVRVEDVPVVNNGGIHSVAEKSGSVVLDAGMNPIRLGWFNGPTEFTLNLDFEGPGIPRQKVPNSILWHQSQRNDRLFQLQPGLRYEAYEGMDWRDVPDFSLLIPTVTGIATNFCTVYRSRDENCGLVFQGFIQIEHPGGYTFYLKSDDGSRLYVGKPAVAVRVIEPAGTFVSASESFEQAMTDRRNGHWIQMEGEVTFVSQDQRSLKLQMLVGGNDVPVTVLEGGELFATNLLHHWLQVWGVCRFAQNLDDKRLLGVFVPGPEQVKIYKTTNESRNDSSKVLLINTAQVRRLKSDQAAKNIPVKIRGVVIYASLTAMVLQDSTGGIFISYRDGYWPEQPKVGDLWEVEGVTDSGLFSPVITADKVAFLGYAPMPEPIQPTRDQLMNGNMDAEYGELHGVITSVTNNEITLLTADGKVGVVGNSDRPLPVLPKTIPGNGSLIGSVVRIRGCFAPMVDLQTRQVVSGKTYIYPASVEVEDPAPKEPFQIPARTPSDLMRFNARAVALQRTKLTGQILYALPGEYLVQDGQSSFRVLTQNAMLEAGDLIEAVGFPKLDGPSPILQQAQIRKTGQAELPKPTPVSPENLLNRELDSKLVEFEALLISDTFHQGERILELQSGPQHFVARLESTPGTFTPLPAGCRLQLNGVYASAYGDQNHVGTHIAPFDLLLNSAADITVLQRPPWWTIQRVVMLLAVVLGVLSGTFIWVAMLRRQVDQRTTELKKEIEQRQLIEQNHAIELERTRVSRDLHDELGAGLTEVGLLGSLANTPAIAQEEKNRYLDQLTRMARSLVTSLDEIVWAVNPHYDSLASLVSYFSLYAESFLDLAGITCRLSVAENIPQYPLDSKQRHGIFCAFKEALNNVVSHSGATEVQIVFEVVEGKLKLSVIDNGCGFEFVPEAPGKDGLASMCQRMLELDGVCRISSEPGRGTSVQICLPLN